MLISLLMYCVKFSVIIFLIKIRFKRYNIICYRCMMLMMLGMVKLEWNLVVYI